MNEAEQKKMNEKYDNLKKDAYTKYIALKKILMHLSL